MNHDEASAQLGHIPLPITRFTVKGIEMPRINVEKLLLEIEIDKVAERLGMELRNESATRKLALCPFHNDKKPSLLIDTSRESSGQHYHCFACGEHGDAIDLVKGVLHIDFKAALEWLLPSSSAGSIKKVTKQKGLSTERSDGSGLLQGYKLYQQSNDKNLLSSWAASRKLDVATLQDAGFVYAHKNSLAKQVLIKKDLGSQRELAGALEEASLIRKVLPSSRVSNYYLNLQSNNETNYIDFFVGDRVVFPIRDEQKKILGLAGRALDGHSAKYLFSKNFQKSKAVFRIEQAITTIKNKAKSGEIDLRLYVCEGFFDALRLESLGLPAVAIMGSSMSREQVQIIKSISEAIPSKHASLTVFICFDRDEAGLKGASEAILKLLSSNLDVLFVWPTSTQLRTAGNSLGSVKDPDEYLRNFSAQEARALLEEATYGPGIAILGNQFGVDADELLDNARWNNATRSRRYRSFERARAEIRKVVGNSPQQLKDLLEESHHNDGLVANSEWLNFLGIDITTDAAISECYLTNSDTRLNHARLLAYMGSRRGELPCEESKWERLDVAASAFNLLLIERLANEINGPLEPFEAVWVPRSFGSEEPRLKVMPQPEDLIIHQYLLNELLTERWDSSALGITSFSHCIPAVRYYREEKRTVTTGLSDPSKDLKPTNLSRTLSFAYQIDMEVIEGRQPASDQGMFRPFLECWRDFMQSLKSQAKEIGQVHAIRLDVSRYYDRIRRHVVRDSIQPFIHQALESVAGNAPAFAELMKMQSVEEQAADKSAIIVEQLCDMIFGYPYLSPDNGRVKKEDPLRGIPQGPVVSAWLGSVALFPVDLVALEIMDKYNVDGEVHLGYARYVDDIVLLASSPTLLEELRQVVDLKTRSLDLALIAKADAIPPMSSDEFSEYVNQGRALEASGPAWEPPLAGDGEAGWEFWSGTPSSDRQSALQLLSNWEIYKSPKETILQTVRTSFLAMDLRASELAKGARLIWYVVASDLDLSGMEPRFAADDAWKLYCRYWNESTEGCGWRLDADRFGWEAPILFALEGLEKLIDHKNSIQSGLNAAENTLRNKRISYLAKTVLEEKFRGQALEDGSKLCHQIEKRLDLLIWKASKACGMPVPRTSAYAEKSKYVRSWRPFDWLHAAVEDLMQTDPADSSDPLSRYVTQFKSIEKNISAAQIASYDFFRYLLPSSGNDDDLDFFSKTGNRYSGLAIQVLLSLVPRESIIGLLSNRVCLLSPLELGIKLLIMPPLPGVNQTRMVACKVDDFSESKLKKIKAFESYEVNSEERSSSALVFYGVQGGTVVVAVPEWSSATGDSGSLLRLTSDLSEHPTLELFDTPPVGGAAFQDLKRVATIYRSLVLIMAEYERQNDGLELIPAWPYLASNKINGDVYLICDGAKRGEVGNRAFIRDGGRALRTVEVPIYEAQLWRAGVALSDYLGLHDDISKFSSFESEVPLNESTLTDPAQYVLRSQLRKLRGAFANSQIGRRTMPPSFLPASIERALELLEGFPEPTESPELKLIHLLATETETAGMRVRYEKNSEITELTVFLRAVAGRVITKLPLSIGEALSASADESEGGRRDLIGLVTFARTLWRMNHESKLSPVFAWRVFQGGVVSIGIAVALQGMISSLRSHGDFSRFEGFDFPPEWEIPSASPSKSDYEKVSFEDMSLLDLLRMLVSHLGHRMRLDKNNNPQLPVSIIEKIKEISLAVFQLVLQVPSSSEASDWPFYGVTERSLSILNLDLLESVFNLLRDLDAALGFQVILVKQQIYGFNAQTKRFTDSRGLAWDIKPWMISQYPVRARHVEESLDCDRRVVKVWTEVRDRNGERLLSISVLGEPFASIALTKNQESSVRQNADGESDGVATPRSIRGDDLEMEAGDSLIKEVSSSESDFSFKESGINTISETQYPASGHVFNTEEQSFEGKVREAASALITDAALNARINSFKRGQLSAWSERRKSKNLGHIRVAFFQWNQELSYSHPMVEAAPKNWPFSFSCKSKVAKELKHQMHTTYAALISATESSGLNHLWTHEKALLPSWAEHRRRRLLLNVVNACQSFGVDLLILPEYSVRAETVKWLRDECLPGKVVAVLAGTYLEFDAASVPPEKSAKLNLLWPVPPEVRDCLKALDTPQNIDPRSLNDKIERGVVLQWTRSKKYRSVALNEFIRPGNDLLNPLFLPSNILPALRSIGLDLDADGVIKLLADTHLPLANFMELICSEIFLFTSPTNIPEMARDYVAMCARFGLGAEEEEVWKDLKKLSKWLSVCSTHVGADSRRSILIVPAATTRTADYWIAGQAGLLAAGTTTVFINGTGSGLKGGSCFIGRESWKNGTAANGYIEALTPYHGWSKGIYYNSKDDPLSESDQALVIADIDSRNMLEGKPRPQMLPIPLQLVAYLPVVETVDYETLDHSLCAVVSVAEELASPSFKEEELVGQLKSRSKFWNQVALSGSDVQYSFFEEFCKNFSDERPIKERAKSFFNNGHQQPFSSVVKQDLLASPALYDWVEVDMTLREGDSMPSISVPKWTR